MEMDKALYRTKSSQKALTTVLQLSTSQTPKYKFGVEVPRNVKHALEIDKANGNTTWMDAMMLEINQLNNYETFK